MSSEVGATASECLRFAIYYVPPEASRLAAAAAQWLGRTAADGRDRGGVVVPGISRERLQQVRRMPFHYGFHATIKPPFRLREPLSLDQISGALAQCCASLSPVSLPPLEVTALGAFFCIRPMTACPAIHALAEAVVKGLDAFRQPPDEAELTRRRRGGLTTRQDRLLQRWGYPYLFDEYRFHFTLTGPIDDPHEQAALDTFLRDHFDQACREPLVVDQLSLCVEAGGQPLRVAGRCRFPGA